MTGNKSFLSHVYRSSRLYTLVIHAMCYVLRRDTGFENLNTLHSYL